MFWPGRRAASPTDRGRTGYLALYRFLPHIDRVPVPALRHQREAGYRSV